MCCIQGHGNRRVGWEVHEYHQGTIPDEGVLCEESDCAGKGGSHDVTIKTNSYFTTGRGSFVEKIMKRPRTTHTSDSGFGCRAHSSTECPVKTSLQGWLRRTNKQAAPVPTRWMKKTRRITHSSVTAALQVYTISYLRCLLLTFRLLFHHNLTTLYYNLIVHVLSITFTATCTTTTTTATSMVYNTSHVIHFNSFPATGLYIGFWPIPGFCRFWIFHLWWAIIQFFKILWIQTIICHDFTSYLVTFSPYIISQCVCFNWHALMLISQK